MSHITKLIIRNYRGVKELSQEFGDEKLIVLIGRGDSGKSTILSAINAALSPSWNLSFSDLDFYNQDTSQPIEIELTIKELPSDLLKESKFGFYLQNDLDEDCKPGEEQIILKLTVDKTLEPRWVVKARPETNNEDKPISGSDRALFAVNFISDYTDHQFAYNRQSPLYALTKANLTDGNTIEHVKAELIRAMSASVDGEKLTPLNAPLESLKQTAGMLGLNVSDLCAHIDIKENPYTGNSIALHDDKLPYRLHGKGSKRLMSIAIQTELTKHGGIVLVDELEQGLEPDRIVTLTRILKGTKSGQVFITTHNADVVSECECHNLFVRHKDSSILLNVPESLYACRRYNPNVFFARKVILCEGDTEQGFLRAVDNWLWAENRLNFSSQGVVLANVGGGANMYIYALRLHELGYGVCVFADDDQSQQHKTHKENCFKKGIKLFLCNEGNCLEQQLLNDLSWNGVAKLIQCGQTNFPKTHVIPSDNMKAQMEKCTNNEQEQALRNDIASKAKTDKWFKHIPGGEFLGSIFIEVYDEIKDEACMKQNIDSLLKWCGITE
ncbi:MAG: AAA family ATPase [Bacteroidaceae bacterium]|nr:AAA family ATPase [Bacteroidaceae bacterium]